jgi:DNA gyrase subunit A
MGRATQGVKIIRLKDDDSIASVAKVSKWEAEEQVLLDEDGNVIEVPETIEVDNSSEETTDTNEDTEEENNNNNQTPDDNEEN